MTTKPRTAPREGAPTSDSTDAPLSAPTGASIASIGERDIAGFVVERFLPDVAAAELDSEYDLLATAVIDSLGVLHVAAWLEQRYGIILPDEELTGANFRTVRVIHATAERAAARGGQA